MYHRENERGGGKSVQAKRTFIESMSRVEEASEDA